MAEIARFGGVGLLVGVFLACSPDVSHRGLTEEVGTPERAANSESETLVAKRFLDKPRFVNGGVRCEVQIPDKRRAEPRKQLASPAIQALSKQPFMERVSTFSGSGLF